MRSLLNILRHAFLSLSLVSFAFYGLAQTNPAATSQPGSSTGKISGRVLSTLGAPIAKASVRLTPGAGTQNGKIVQPPTYIEISGPDGSFTFENLPDGRYQVSAQRPGFLANNFDGITGASLTPQVTLAGGETKQNVEIKMNPLASVSGRVLDRDGDPVPNAQLRILRYIYRSGRTDLQPTSSTSSDDRGVFRIANVEPGRYYLVADDILTRVNQSSQEIRGQNAQTTNLTTYYPSSVDVRNAARLDIKYGLELSGMDIRMARGRVFAVRGTALDGAGAPLQAQLTMVERNNAGGSILPLSTSANATTGAFSFGAVPAGDYVLTARSLVARVLVQQPATANSAAGPVMVPANPIPQPILFGRFDVNVRGGNLDGLRLQLAEGPTITGHLVLEGGGPLDQQVTTTVNGTVTQTRRAGSVLLLDAEAQAGQLSGQLQPDGGFSITNVTPGRYSLSTTGLPGLTYLKSIRIGGQDVTGQYLDFSSGAGASLEVTLGSKPAKITGTVQNTKGEPALAGVVAWAKTPRLADANVSRRLGRSDATGPFTIQGLAPGEYYIAAFEDISQEFLQIPDFLARFNGSLKTVKLAEGASETVEPKWITREATDKEAASFPE